MINAEHKLKAFFCLFNGFLVSGSKTVFSHGDYVKALGKHIAALSEGLAVLSNGEIHSSVCVNALFVKEVNACLGVFFPERVFTVTVHKRREGPQTSALEPNGFIVVVALAVFVNTGNISAVDLVQQIAVCPEGDTVIHQLIVIKLTVACKSFLFHIKYTSGDFYFGIYILINLCMLVNIIDKLILR